MESNEKIILTKSESRAAHAAQWLVTALILVNAGFALFSFREILHIGVQWVVFGAALCVVSVLIAAAFIVLFFKRLVYIKPHKKHYIVLLIVFFLAAAVEIWHGAYFAADLFGGSREVVTNEFTVAPAATVSPKSATARIILYADGEDMVFYVPKSVAAELREVPLNVPPEEYAKAISENGLLFHSKQISIKYFPYSNIFEEARVVQ